jgi:hypothetical protein
MGRVVHLLLGVGLLIVCGFAIQFANKKADMDNVVIAKIDDEDITRAGLMDVLRKMPDDKRPIIRSKGDVLRVLRSHLDKRIKEHHGRMLEVEGKVQIPRELAENVWREEDPDWANIGPDSLADFGMGEDDWQFIQEEREIRIDKVQDRLLGEAALQYLAMEGANTGSLTVTQEEIEREYRLQKYALQTKERIAFLGIRFPDAYFANGLELAAGVRKRIDGGEDFDAVAADTRARGLQNGLSLVSESEIENDPAQDRFDSFWMTAEGAETGSVLGPVFMPEYTLMGRDADGQMIQVPQPASFLVLKVLSHEPARVKSIEEARPELLGPMLIAKVMDQLRTEHGVEIYEDKLPNPALYGEALNDPSMGF